MASSSFINQVQPIPASPGRTLIVKGKAGMGNRLLCAVSSFLYAQATSRTLCIDWSDNTYSDNGLNSFPSYFSAPRSLNIEQLSPSTSVAPPPWIGNLSTSVNELMYKFEKDENADSDSTISSKYTINLSKSDYREDVIVRWAWSDEIHRFRRRLLPGGMRFLSDSALLSHTICQNFTLAPGVQSQVDAFSAKRFSDRMIGVHVRQSDRIVPVERYFPIIDRIRSQHPGAGLFLATDNRNVEELLKNRYQNVVSTAKWFAPPGTPLHRTRDCPNKLQGGWEALNDIYLLARCQHLVYSHASTFGVVARLLSHAPAAQVFDVSPLPHLLARRVREKIRWTWACLRP
jgi:hypothetical protein